MGPAAPPKGTLAVNIGPLPGSNYLNLPTPQSRLQQTGQKRSDQTKPPDSGALVVFGAVGAGVSP